MASFDIHDRASWYFGPMSRLDATELLMSETETGVFLVRDSNTIIGDYVLCVREETKVGHYIIHKIENGDQIYYRIGDQMFADLPELLDFYKFHYLDSTPLVRAANRILLNKTEQMLNKIERVIAKFDFDGSDQDDLPFRRGEVLTIVSKDEDQWWTAKNSVGQIGQIPVPYVQMCETNSNERPGSSGSGSGVGTSNVVGGGSGTTNGANCTLIQNSSNNSQLNNMRTISGSGGGNNTHQIGSSLKKSDLNRKLPALARVKQTRIPNAYDKTALKLEVGDIITVTKTNINGQWEGELKGKRGHFPFTHVEFIEDSDNCCNTTQPIFQQQQCSPGIHKEISNQQQQNGTGSSGGGGNSGIKDNLITNNEWGD